MRAGSAALALAACGTLVAALAWPAHAHDRAYDTRVRISGYVDNASFLGRVGSERKACKRKRRVTVWRRNPGAMDAPVGTAKSNGKGIWAVAAPAAPPGRYYAIAKKRGLPKPGHRHVCGRARSKLFQL